MKVSGQLRIVSGNSRPLITPADSFPNPWILQDPAVSYIVTFKLLSTEFLKPGTLL